MLYVAVGASDTVGVGTADPQREAWPRGFLRTALPEGTQYRTFATSGATTATALQRQVPKAVELQPDVVTVWLNVNDLVRFVPAPTYESQLRMAVRRLRRGGRSTVLVATTPAIEQLPVVASFGIPADVVRQSVEAYNAAIVRVAQAEGAVVVDLHSHRIEAELVAADGFHPSPAGHAAVAAAFTAAYRGAPNTEATNASEAS
ncbi:MAG TPA: GDSL-type esterase/lipase family protein [Acidimicrobiales bacterium]|nr:GDSL-type esterase/lipase family protein [Acidimicrobiales bacterium]